MDKVLIHPTHSKFQGIHRLKSINDYPKDEREMLTKEFLKQVYFEFRRVGLRWAELTRQTSFFPKGYLGQNLVSLITGIPGTGTAARGDDLKDGSEVKTCARVDQLNSCKDCKSRIASYFDVCPNCKKSNIKHMVDSHWICTITDRNYEKYRSATPSIYFLLVDDDNLDPEFLARFTVWQIIPKDNLKWQSDYVDSYYHNNYLVRMNKKQKPAPMNVHPNSPKFNSIQPVKIFESTISVKGVIEISKFPD